MAHLKFYNYMAWKVIIASSIIIGMMKEEKTFIATSFSDTKI